MPSRVAKEPTAATRTSPIVHLSKLVMGALQLSKLPTEALQLSKLPMEALQLSKFPMEALQLETMVRAMLRMYSSSTNTASGGSDVEMGQVNGGYAKPSGMSQKEILDACSQIKTAIGQLNDNIQTLRRKWKNSLDLADGQTDQRLNEEISALNNLIFSQNRELSNRMTRLKKTPGAGENAQTTSLINSVSKSLFDTFGKYQQAEYEYRRGVNAQVARQYKTVNPQATESEIQAAVENPQGGVFTQAVRVRSDLHTIFR